MAAQKTINLTAQIRDALAEAVDSLEQSSLFALAGERLGKLPPDLDLPEAATVMTFGRRGWPEMKDRFPAYCARYALIGVVTACEVYLQRLLFVAALADRFRQLGNLTGEEFYKTRRRWLRDVRHSSVDGLVRSILKRVDGDETAIAGLKCFRSIYSMRTCLLHRGGIVGQDDVDDSGVLQTTWQKATFAVGENEITELPYIAGAGQVLSVRFADEVRCWQPGETVQLSAEDCQYISFSLALFCGQVANELQKRLAALLGPMLTT